MLSLLTESIKSIWPVYANENFDMDADEIGWILFAFYFLNSFGQILVYFLLYHSKSTQLTSSPTIILFISSLIIFFQGTTIKNYRVESHIQIIILFSCLGLISYHTLYNITITFSNIILPYKYSMDFIKNTMSSTHLLFGIIGPLMSGLILYFQYSDYYLIFYITAIISIIMTIFSFIVCGKQGSLQLMQNAVKYNDDEHTKLNGRESDDGHNQNGHPHRHRMYSRFNENEFPVNNLNDIDSDIEIICTIDLYHISIIITSFCSHSVIQIIINWYIFYMKNKSDYNTKEWISASQIALGGFSAVIAIVIFNKITQLNKYQKCFLRTFRFDHISYHFIHILVPIIFTATAYFMRLIKNQYLFWGFSPIFGIIYGIFYQYNFILFWKQQIPANMTNYYLIQFISNIGASIGNLICGILLNNDLDLFWWVILGCFALQFMMAIFIYMIHCAIIMIRGDNKKGKSILYDDGLASDFSASPDVHNKWNSDVDKWKNDDVVGDIAAKKLTKKYKDVGTASQISNSLGILDVDPSLMASRQRSNDSNYVAPVPDTFNAESVSNIIQS